MIQTFRLENACRKKRYVKKNKQMYVKENAEIEVKSRNLADIAFNFS